MVRKSCDTRNRDFFFLTLTYKADETVELTHLPNIALVVMAGLTIK